MNEKSINKYKVTITLMGKFERSQIREFLEWILSINFKDLSIKSENNSLRITTDDINLVEAILTASEFERYAFKITEILDDDLNKIVEKWR